MKKLYYALDSICGNRWFLLLFVPIAFCFLLLYSYSTSPFYVGNGCDSMIFKTMGLAILQGKTPYLDLFDHKGPILYLINAVGQWMVPGRFGIFVLQIVSLSVSLIFWFKTAKLIGNSLLSFVWVIVALCIMGVFFEGGNLTEEWNLPFIAISLYCSISYFVRNSEKQHPIKYSLVYAICFGMSFFIRPNDAVAQIGGVMTGVTLWLLYKKEYKNAINNAISFFLGFAIIAIPILVWFAIRGALDEFYYGLLKFNSMYSEGIASLLRSVIGKEKLKFFMFFVVLCVMVYNSVHKKLLFLMIPLLLFVVALMGTRPYPHYYIVVAPFFMLFFVFLCVQHNKSIIVCALAVIIASHIDTLKTARKTSKIKVKYALHVLKNGVDEPSSFKETDRILQFVPKGKRDQIWNYNLDFDLSMLWRNGLVQANKVPLFSMYLVDNKLKEEDNLIQQKPEYVLFSDDHSKDSSDYVFILSNYDKVVQTDSTVCRITLFKRK